MVRNKKKKVVAATLGREPFGTADVIIYVIMGLLVLTMVIPFLNVVAISLSGYEAAVQNTSMLFPKDTIGAEEQPWVNLLENGYLPEIRIPQPRNWEHFRPGSRRSCR